MRARPIANLLRGLTTAAALVAVAVAPAPGLAAEVTSTFDDPLEGEAFVADLGRTDVTLGDDGVLRVSTRIVARPPAGWGGCVQLPAGICLPARMSVSWLVDRWAGGDPSLLGADTRVVATPSPGQTTWESALWDRYAGRWRAGAVPTATTDATGASWSLPLLELGLGSSPPEPITRGRRERVELSVLSRFSALDGSGQTIEGVDTAGPWPITHLTYGPALPMPAVGDGPAERRYACAAASRRARRIDSRIRRVTRMARSPGPAAQRRAARAELRRLRAKRLQTEATKRRTCPTTAVRTPTR